MHRQIEERERERGRFLGMPVNANISAIPSIDDSRLHEYNIINCSSCDGILAEYAHYIQPPIVVDRLRGIRFIKVHKNYVTESNFIQLLTRLGMI